MEQDNDCEHIDCEYNYDKKCKRYEKCHLYDNDTQDRHGKA